jgi:hypothetical protein
VKFTLESPEVQALLSGVFRCSPQTYFRICPETGKHFVYPIRKHLMALGMCSKTASLFLQKANLPFASFITNNREEEDSTPPEKPPKKSGPAPLTEQRRAEKAAANDAVANSKRFQFITTNSGRFGIFDGFSGKVIRLFLARSDAIEELIRLQTGKTHVIDD